MRKCIFFVFYKNRKENINMGRKTRECKVCGQKYKYCPTCSQDKNKPSWMALLHEENCMKIWDICTRFNMELMSKEEAKEAILKCDLSKKETFVDFVQKDIENILFEEPKPVVVEEVKPANEVKPVFKKQDLKKHEVVNTIE